MELVDSLRFLSDIVEQWPIIEEATKFLDSLDEVCRTRARTRAADNAEEVVVDIPVAVLRWTQDTISAHCHFFHDESNQQASHDEKRSMYELLDELFRERKKPEDLQPLEVVVEGRKLWCMSNRRLTVLKMYQATTQDRVVYAPCVIRTCDKTFVERKYQSKSQGLCIQPRDLTASPKHLGKDLFGQDRPRWRRSASSRRRRASVPPSHRVALPHQTCGGAEHATSSSHPISPSPNPAPTWKAPPPMPPPGEFITDDASPTAPVGAFLDGAGAYPGLPPQEHSRVNEGENKASTEQWFQPLGAQEHVRFELQLPLILPLEHVRVVRGKLCIAHLECSVDWGDGHSLASLFCADGEFVQAEGDAEMSDYNDINAAFEGTGNHDQYCAVARIVGGDGKTVMEAFGLAAKKSLRGKVAKVALAATAARRRGGWDNGVPAWCVQLSRQCDALLGDRSKRFL